MTSFAELLTARVTQGIEEMCTYIDSSIMRTEDPLKKDQYMIPNMAQVRERGGFETEEDVGTPGFTVDIVDLLHSYL